jgi:MFS family permease
MLTRKFPNLYYGWYIAFALAITETVSYGAMFYAFSVFITPMEATMGWTRGELSGAFSLMLLVMGIMAFPIGYWIDKHGARGLMTLGSIGATILMILWAHVTSITSLYVIFALLGVCGAAVFYEPAFAVIATWFIHKRGTAMSIVTFTAGFASTIFIPTADFLLNQVGWRQSVLILAVVLGVVTIPLHLLILRRRPEDLGLYPDGEQSIHVEQKSDPMDLKSVWKSRFFWIMTLAFALSSLAISAVRVHFIPLLISLNVNASVAAVASGSIGIMQVVGRVFFAPVERHFSSKTMVIGVFALLTLSVSTLLLGASPLLIMLFIALYGMGIGTHTLVRPLIVADTYGAKYYGRISSSMVIFLTGAGTIGPFFAGIAYDAFGSYMPMIIGVTGFSLVSIVLILVLPSNVKT